MAERVDVVEIYDPATRTWTKGAPLRARLSGRCKRSPTICCRLVHAFCATSASAVTAARRRCRTPGTSIASANLTMIRRLIRRLLVGVRCRDEIRWNGRRNPGKRRDERRARRVPRAGSCRAKTRDACRLHDTRGRRSVFRELFPKLSHACFVGVLGDDAARAHLPAEPI